MAYEKEINQNMERFELHTFGIRAMLDTAREELGEQAVEQMLAELGVSLAAATAPEGWMSLSFVEGLLARMVERSGDRGIIERFGRRSISAKYLGLLYPIICAFGTPELAYQQVVDVTKRIGKVGYYEIRDKAPGYVCLGYARLPGAPHEQQDLFCYARQVMLANVVTLFGLPPAETQHPACLLRGDDACVYELRWRAPQSRAQAWWGLCAGLAMGLALALGLALPAVTATVLIASCGGLGGMVGRNRSLRRSLDDRIDDVIAYRDALTRSMHANEERFQQLLEAKIEVDRKVEARTAELHQATQRLSQTLHAVQALDRAKTDFFNNVSHELRSPLTLILAPLEDLVAGRTPPGGAKQAFDAMHRSATRLLRLINQLLDLAKIDAGETKISPVATDLEALVRSLFSGFTAAAEKRRIALQLAVPDDLRPVVLDPAWIESALTNLVANALRFSPRGKTVRVAIEEHGSEVRVAVSDDGPGIPPEDQQKVFERFAQGEVAKRAVGGTGIGLALVREAARLHGGSVDLVSEVHCGATFTLSLPRRPEPQAPRVPSEQPQQKFDSSSQLPAAGMLVAELDEAQVVDAHPGPSPGAPLSLVVEDNPELRQFLVNVLGVRYRVRTANDGRQGAALALKLRPDVVVSDVAMPEMDGYALCRALRAEAATLATPIVLVTARTEIASVLEGFNAGANDYIAKPFHGRELLARVDVHVRLRRMMQEFAVRERHAMLGVLAASIAHQVRNPLTSLISGLPAMRSRLGDGVSPATVQLLDVMIDCANRIERLTTDLTDLSRVDREVSGPYRPSDGLRAALRLLQARLPHCVELEERIEDAPTIEGRPGDMSHVFLNLLDNAARAVGEAGRLRVEGRVIGGAYVVSVGDSGPGIDEATAPRIFEPFFTTREAGQGTGLGLAIAQQVIMQCGGRIELGRSDLGGALFTARIPLALPRSTGSPVAIAVS